MAANHEVIHLALIFAQLICTYYYQDDLCSFERNFDTSYFLIAHAWCFICKMISYWLDWFGHYEWADICKISYVPLYFVVIFKAHYYELHALITHTESCGDDQINFFFQWYIIELRVFYGYILGGVLFIVVCQLFGIDKKRR